jgi:hypothetical protein
LSNTKCAEVLLPPGPVRLLLIAERLEGFFVERFTETGELVGQTQHDMMDEAMQEVYSEYEEISDWSLCPDGVDPLEYVRSRRT